MAQLLLIRHGETNANLGLRFQGQLDVPLNATGQEQARRLAQRARGWTAPSANDALAPLCAPLAPLVVSSDLSRARQTAEPLAQALGLPLQTLADLREQSFGVWEGASGEEIAESDPHALQHWLRFEADYAFAGGESTRAFDARVCSALAALAAAHSADLTLPVVLHGGVLEMVWRRAKGLGLDGKRVSRIPNAGLNLVRLQPSAGEAFEVLHWADTAHLAGMPPQPTYHGDEPND